MTGVTREARTLNGADVGRLIERHPGEWEPITAIHHEDSLVRIDWGEAWGEDYEFFNPTDTVTIRGRDDRI